VCGAAIVSFQAEETFCALVRMSEGGRKEMILSRSSVVLSTSFRLAWGVLLRLIRRDSSDDAGSCFLVGFATRDLYTMGYEYLIFAMSLSLCKVDFVAGCWLVVLRFC
jgi:hypothetical protein